MIGIKNVMRDVFIVRLCERMKDDKSIFFLAADFGSPKLDKLRADFSDRFINVGIAEQNLVNVATGLALEGFAVYAYAIAPFMIMRAYEQIRNNLSLLSHTHDINVNLVGVGAGLSYDVSGPTHHSVEDICIVRALPNMTVFSPSDWTLAEKFVDYSIRNKSPKYIRFDGKPLPALYDASANADIEKGFHELAKGDELCLVSTGYMTHTAIKALDRLRKENISVGLIDIFLIKPAREELLYDALSAYNNIMTIEEGFINKGGLDALVAQILSNRDIPCRQKNLGFADEYTFEIGGREYLHKLCGLDEESIAASAKEMLKSCK